MSFRVGGFLNSLGGDNQIGSTPTFAGKQTAGEYQGGSLSVTISRSDTQQTFARRGLHDHAIAAGLNETEANKFADKWTNSKTTLKHYDNGNARPYTPQEFAALKTKGKTNFDLSKEYDADVLADLNARVEENRPIVVEANPAYTSEERTAMLARKTAGANQAAITEKPIATLIDGKTSDGKPIDADTALTRYVQQTYNPKNDGGSRRVWGDKINEMVSQAKTDGVNINLQFNEDGTAFVGVNAADKQKLDALFKDALDKTILGEKGSEKAQREETGQVVDIPIMAGNGIINTVNHATEPIRGTLETFGVDTSGAKLPKIPYQSEYGKKNGMAGEIGTEIGVGIMSAPSLLKTAAGKVFFGVDGAYNVAAGTVGIDPTEKGENGKPREMSTLERGMRIVGGAGEIFGARPTFETAGKTGTTLAKAEETIEALTPDGQTIRVQVPKGAQTATEAATAKPLQTAEDLVSEMRGRGGYESNEITTRGGTKMPKVQQPFEVSPSIKPDAANKAMGIAEKIPANADVRLTRGLTRQNEAAETLAKNGYKVEHRPQISGSDRMSNPWLGKDKKPDFKVEGEIFDAYSPDVKTDAGGIKDAIKGKVEAGQTRRIILNMDDSSVKLDELKKLILEKPVVELEQILVVKDGQVTKFFPFNN